jgi:haloacid dehalogenase-like hydrolase
VTRARLLLFATLVACDPKPADVPASATPPIASASSTTFRRCLATPPPELGPAGFAHDRSALMAKTMTAAHHAQDAVALPDAPFSVEVKLTYGEIGKDLEDEPVRAWLDDCNALVELPGSRSDHDGRATFEVPAHAAGVYALHFAVVGDGSRAQASAFVLPAQTEIVVFDIDGTLTTDDAEVTHDAIDERFEAYRDGSYSAKAHAHGDELAKIWADKGFVPVYVTGRPYWLCEHSRAWLRDGAYPFGLVHTTNRHRDCVPSVEGVGQFKADFLAQLRSAGYRIAAAYGNAPTDVWAYAQAKIPVEHTFIIGPHAGEGGTVAVQGDWSAALPWARQHADAAQPFAWDH